MTTQARGTNSCSALASADFEELVAVACQYTEARGFIVWLLEKASKALSPPADVARAIGYVLEPALKLSNWAASKSHGSTDEDTFLGKASALTHGKWVNRLAVTASGGVAGLGGAPAALSEITFTTTVILRQIQAIARRYGEDLEDPYARIECMSVMALGGPDKDDDQLDESFWLTRSALFAGITEKTVGGGFKKAVSTETGKLLLGLDPVQKFLQSEGFKKLLERFGITTQAAFAAKLAPILSVASGAYVNYSFMSYYQDMAHVHYRLKRLERSYDREQIRSCFSNIRSERTASKKLGSPDADG